MAASAWVVHDRFKEYKGDNTIDMDADAWAMRLYTSASNVSTTSVGDATTATNELGTANGYTSGGVVIAGTWVRSGDTVTFDAADASWTAVGALTARYAAIIDTTTTPDEVVAHCVLDATPADVTATDAAFNINMNALGVFSET